MTCKQKTEKMLFAFTYSLHSRRVISSIQGSSSQTVFKPQPPKMYIGTGSSPFVYIMAQPPVLTHSCPSILSSYSQHTLKHLHKVSGLPVDSPGASGFAENQVAVRQLLKLLSPNGHVELTALQLGTLSHLLAFKRVQAFSGTTTCRSHKHKHSHAYKRENTHNTQCQPNEDIFGEKKKKLTRSS